MRKKKKLSGMEQMEVKLKREYKFLKRFKDKNENHLLFAAFLVVMTSMVVVNTIFIIDYESASHNSNSSVVTPNPNKVLPTSQNAKTDAYDARVSNVTVTDKIDHAFTLAPTDTLLVLDITITNTSEETQQLTPALQFYVRDPMGGLYMPHVSSNVTAPLEFAKVGPHKTVMGQLSFAIPKTLAHPLLYLDLGWNDNAPTVIDVMR